MDVELEKLKKLEHALCDAIDILRDWQVDEVAHKICSDCKYSETTADYKPCICCIDGKYWAPKESPCPCEDGIDSKACVGCEHSEDGKKEYRPYESSAEMIVDLIDRFKVKCPSYCEPLIWVKVKSNDARFLITGFGKKVSVDGVSYSLDELFKYYAYLDGSPVGMEVKE